jgi:predicted membrane protein
MESQPEWDKKKNEMMNNLEESHRRGKVVGGIIIVLVGALFLAREMGVIMPPWLLSWKVLLIVAGLFVGIKHAFRNWGWMIPVIIGGVFLMQDIYPQFVISNYFWPLAIIVFGLIIIFKPRRKWRDYEWKGGSGKHWKAYTPGQTIASDDFLEINSVFGSVQKNIISKDFKGGEINVVFGGAEINLSQAELTGASTLEVNIVFGGTKLIVPPHWEIKSELTAVMGGVEDKRMARKEFSTEETKILVLKGDVVFGGLEIRSF